MELSFDVLQKTTSPKIQNQAAIHQEFQLRVCKIHISLSCYNLSLLYFNDKIPTYKIL